MSVLPAIIDDIFPIRESGPYVDKISFRSIIVDEDEIGLNIAIGSISLGDRFMFIRDIISFRKLLFTKTVTEMIMVNIDGNPYQEWAYERDYEPKIIKNFTIELEEQ